MGSLPLGRRSVMSLPFVTSGSTAAAKWPGMKKLLAYAEPGDILVM